MVALAAGSVAVVGLGLCLLVGWFFISYFRCPSGPLDTGPECGDTIPLATIFNTLAQAMLCIGVVTVALLRLSARVQVGPFARRSACRCLGPAWSRRLGGLLSALTGQRTAPCGPRAIVHGASAAIGPTRKRRCRTNDRNRDTTRHAFRATRVESRSVRTAGRVGASTRSACICAGTVRATKCGSVAHRNRDTGPVFDGRHERPRRASSRSQ
jgi:hypothetical protein